MEPLFDGLRALQGDFSSAERTINHPWSEITFGHFRHFGVLISFFVNFSQLRDHWAMPSRGNRSVKDAAAAAAHSQSIQAFLKVKKENETETPDTPKAAPTKRLRTKSPGHPVVKTEPPADPSLTTRMAAPPPGDADGPDGGDAEASLPETGAEPPKTPLPAPALPENAIEPVADPAAEDPAAAPEKAIEPVADAPAEDPPAAPEKATEPVADPPAEDPPAAPEKAIEPVADPPAEDPPAAPEKAIEPVADPPAEDPPAAPEKALELAEAETLPGSIPADEKHAETQATQAGDDPSSKTAGAESVANTLPQSQSGEAADLSSKTVGVGSEADLADTLPEAEAIVPPSETGPAAELALAKTLPEKQDEVAAEVQEAAIADSADSALAGAATDVTVEPPIKKFKKSPATDLPPVPVFSEEADASSDSESEMPEEPSEELDYQCKEVTDGESLNDFFCDTDQYSFEYEVWKAKKHVWFDEFLSDYKAFLHQEDPEFDLANFDFGSAESSSDPVEDLAEWFRFYQKKIGAGNKDPGFSLKKGATAETTKHAEAEEEEEKNARGKPPESESELQIQNQIRIYNNLMKFI